MTFRFGSWNVNSRRLASAHADVLRSVDCDVLALQEVSTHFHADLQALGLFAWSVSSLALRPSGEDEGRARRVGCSLFGRSPFRLVASDVLAHLAFPERSLVALADSDAGPITLCSFHIPPGASWGEIKPQTLKAIAEWLASHNGRIVFGIDANTPKTDHPDAMSNEWWWAEEPILLGAKPPHPLRDALRVFLEARPDMLATISAERPRGPLAISHWRGRGTKRTACRYDFIYVSPGIVVEDVEYMFDEAVKAGSDHAFVAARLRVERQLPNPSLKRTGSAGR